jgi:hypothetical protein
MVPYMSALTTFLIEPGISRGADRSRSITGRVPVIGGLVSLSEDLQIKGPIEPASWQRLMSEMIARGLAVSFT